MREAMATLVMSLDSRQRPSTSIRQPRGAGKRRAQPTPYLGSSVGIGASAISHAAASLGR
jgi:hypothetical protein